MIKIVNRFRAALGVRARPRAAFEQASSNRKSLFSGAHLATLIPCLSRQPPAMCIKRGAEFLTHETHEMTRKEEIMELIYKDESYAIIGACFEVYKDKGCGFHEPIYHECLEIELEFQRIPFLSKPPQTLQYRSRTLVQTFNPDFICYDKIILEIKAVSQLIDEHRAQVLNYLAATGCQPGLLVNFGHYPRIEYERLLPRKHEPVDLRL
jgi:GxxExxY protein